MPPTRTGDSLGLTSQIMSTLSRPINQSAEGGPSEANLLASSLEPMPSSTEAGGKWEVQEGIRPRGLFNMEWNSTDFTGMTNCSLNVSNCLGSMLDDHFRIDYIKVIFIILYAGVFTLCVVGNVLVIYVVLRHRMMRTATNFFLGNLAVADLSVGIFCIIPNLMLYLSPIWYLGKVVCKLLFFVQMMSYAASITILTIISIERYFAILHPLRCKTWKRFWILKVTVLVIWLVSAMTGIPHLLIRDTVTFPTGESFCIINKVAFNRKAYVTTNFLVWYVVPLVMMSIMYARISVVLWKTSRLDRLSSNALRRWRQHKRVKYTYTANSRRPGERYINGHAVGEGPRIAIEDEYQDRSSSSLGSSAEDARPDCAGACSSSSSCTCAWKRCSCSSPVAHGCGDTNLTGLQSPVKEEASCPRRGSRGNHKESALQRKNTGGHHTRLSPMVTDPPSTLNEYSSEVSSTWAHNDSCASTDISLTREQLLAPRGTTEEKASPPATAGASTTSAAVAAAAAPSVARRLSTGWDCIVNRVNRPFSRERWQMERRDPALLARRRVIRLLMIVIGCFAFCVMPYHIQMLVNEWGLASHNFLQELANQITFLLFYSNSALNPLLYAFLSDNFRKSLFELLHNYRCRRRPPAGHMPVFQPSPRPASAAPKAMVKSTL